MTVSTNRNGHRGEVQDGVPGAVRPPATEPDRSSGLHRAAALMRALGEDAASVWSVLTPEEAHLIAGEMQDLPPHNPGAPDQTLAALLAGADHGLGGAAATLTQGSIWRRLETASPRRLAVFLAEESPQAAAIVLSRLAPSQSGATVRALPETHALSILHRMVALEPPTPAVLARLEAGLESAFPAERTSENGIGGDAEDPTVRVARVFEAIGGGGAPQLLDALEATDESLGQHIRALMVAFDDLAEFPPAGVQTLLAAVNHETLVLALKGAPAGVRDTVLANMTQRAGAVLVEEMEALGPVPRSDVEHARAQIVAVARDLIERGDIRPDGETEDGDLIE